MPRIIKSPVPPQRKPSVDLLEFKRQEAMSNAKTEAGGGSNNTLMTEVESSESGGSSALGNNGRTTTVKFAKTVKTHDALAVDGDYTQEEKDACWFTSEEKEKFTSKREKILVRLETGRPEKQGKPFRGLECWTESGSKALNEQISLVIDAVMDEQDKQWASGEDDHFMIAKISRELTAGGLQKALDVARDDEETAFAIRGTMFDDVNALTDDDSVVGMASLIAQKRRKNRRVRSKGKADDGPSMAGRKIRRSGRRPDPDGEDADKSVLVKEQKDAAKEAMRRRALARAKANSAEKKKKTRVRIVSDKLNDGNDADDDSMDASAHKKKTASTAPTTRPRVLRQRTAKQAYDEPWR